MFQVDADFIPALRELESLLGFELCGYAPGTIAVPPKLRLNNLPQLRDYLNQILGVQVVGWLRFLNVNF